MKKINSDRLAAKIASYLLFIQMGFTKWMRYYSIRCPLSTLRLFSMVAFAGICFLYASLIFKGVFYPGTIIPPAEHIRLPVTKKVYKTNAITDCVFYNHLHSERIKLDSIRLKTKYNFKDSLLLRRPGLYDSLLTAEKTIERSLKN